MGDYSYVEHSRVKVTDKEKLSALKKKSTCWWAEVIINEGYINFSNFEQAKLEGYWYKESVDFLKELAKCINGWIEFSCDYGYNFRLVFKDNRVLYQKQPDIDWSKAPLSEVEE